MSRNILDEFTKSYKRPWLAWPLLSVALIGAAPIFVLLLIMLIPFFIWIRVEHRIPGWMKKDLFEVAGDYIFEEKPPKPEGGVWVIKLERDNNGEEENMTKASD